MISKQEIKLPIFFTLILVGGLMWNVSTPTGLDVESWHLLITFVLTIFGIITVAAPMGIIALSAICILNLTNTLTLQETLSGFSSSIAWLVVFAFFVAKGFIKTNLGKRIAYYLISKFGSSNIGLAYSLIFTEFVLAPMIPSTSARGGGIIYPIVKSLANEYDDKIDSNRVPAFLIMVCFHSNIICCALFLTSMAGNPLMANIASNFGINIDWSKWAIGAIIPGIVNLIILPFLVAYIISPKLDANYKIVENAKKALQEQGGFTKNQVTMLLVFVLMLFMWIFGKSLSIDTTTTALIGFIVLVIFQVINWEDIITEKAAWDTLIWFAILLTLSDYLAKFGVDRWLEDNIRDLTKNFSKFYAVIILGLFYFYSHYLFASVTTKITVMYATFLLILTELGLPAMPTALGLAIFANLSAGLTHYSIASAPTYFSSGYFSTTEWLRIGFIIASCNLVIWLSIGGLWWKILGWL